MLLLAKVLVIGLQMFSVLTYCRNGQNSMRKQWGWGTALLSLECSDHQISFFSLDTQVLSNSVRVVFKLLRYSKALGSLAKCSPSLEMTVKIPKTQTCCHLAVHQKPFGAYTLLMQGVLGLVHWSGAWRPQKAPIHATCSGLRSSAVHWCSLFQTGNSLALAWGMCC